MQGPRLDAADRSLPLPVLRRRIASVLDQASARLERVRSSAPPANPWALVGDIVRTSVACLALAAGFAGLARSPGRELSLLEELQVSWDHLRYRRSAMRGRSGRTSADADDLRQIGGAEDGEDGSQRKACAGAPLLCGTHPAKDRDRIEPVVVNSGTTAQAF